MKTAVDSQLKKYITVVHSTLGYHAVLMRYDEKLKWWRHHQAGEAHKFPCQANREAEKWASQLGLECKLYDPCALTLNMKVTTKRR